jgi:SPX domain protein involved in polyphosphate accumulation
MKFAKYLEEQSIPEWRKAYLDYKGLKKRLKVIEKVKK